VPSAAGMGLSAGLCPLDAGCGAGLAGCRAGVLNALLLGLTPVEAATPGWVGELSRSKESSVAKRSACCWTACG
jgi:hypothetical protein